jgi:lipoprotein LpqH
MQNRLICAAAILMVVAGAAGCGEEAKPERAKNARITVGGKTQTTREVSCTQVEWSMIIETKSGPTRTRSLLQLGGEKPIAKTVDIFNFDGFSGVAGEGAGSADVSLDNNAYVIAGTAEGSDPDNPGKTRTVPFRIETPC